MVWCDRRAHASSILSRDQANTMPAAAGVGFLRAYLSGRDWSHVSYGRCNLVSLFPFSVCLVEEGFASFSS